MREKPITQVWVIGERSVVDRVPNVSHQLIELLLRIHAKATVVGSHGRLLDLFDLFGLGGTPVQRRGEADEEGDDDVVEHDWSFRRE
nr:MAG TPA: hypothetical protein [Caudoviricetes sp.]